ncbi:MAG: hypothetical protein KC636_18335 [Myxococcales bacterium]|nr:hypothetical protein [Myxococcales bacterium]
MSRDPSDDPFAPAADPYPPAAIEPVAPHPVSRRSALGLVIVGAVATGAIGCAHRRLGCEPAPDRPDSCAHRFCRYYRA